MYRNRLQTPAAPSNFIFQHVPLKRLRFADYTLALPEEILIYIFSFLNHEELYKNVRCVCKRWYCLVSTPTLWKSITVDKHIPTEVLCKWIEHSPLLEEISFVNRNDMNTVAERVSRYSCNLQSIVVKNCWGNSRSNVIQGTHLCKMVKRCQHLNRFNFSQTLIRSTKFFKLLAEKRGLGHLSKCSYCGPISKKQVEALVKSLLNNQQYFVSSLYTGKNKKLTVNHLLSQSTKASLAAQYLWDSILHENPITG